MMNASHEIRAKGKHGQAHNEANVTYFGVILAPAAMAQLAEHLICTQKVVCPIHTGGLSGM